jgi:predicted glycosyltransferase
VLRARKRRLARLIALLDLYRPGCLLVDSFPFDTQAVPDELTTWFAASRELPRPPIIVCSLRDIQNTNLKNQSSFNSQAYDILNDYFDAVLVHSDPSWLSLQDTFPLAEQLTIEIVHTGFVVPNQTVPSRSAVAERRIVVSAGGGRGSEELLFAAIEAQRSGQLSDTFSMEVFAGVGLPDATWNCLNEAAEGVPRLELRRWTNDLRDRLANAAVSVSRSGYNTSLDLLQTRVPALLVPAAANLGDEQLLRANMLARLGLARVIPNERLNAESLAAEIRLAAEFKPAKHSFDFNGCPRSVDWLERRLRNWAAGKSPARWLFEDAASSPKQPIRLPGEIWGVIAFNNFTASATAISNLSRATARLRSQGLRLIVVELALGDAPFVVDDALADRVLRFRSHTILCHRERLINLGVAQLPSSCDKVVWMDGDLLFEDENWVSKTMEKLEAWPLLQPFQSVGWLGPDQAAPPSHKLEFGDCVGSALPGFAYRVSTAPTPCKQAVNLPAFVTGHVGSAWAARRTLLDKYRLYDGMVLGRADMLIGHVLFSGPDYWAKTNRHRLLFSRAQFAHIAEWGKRFAQDVNGCIGYTPGRAFHLWNGLAIPERDDDLLVLREAGFDPGADLQLDATGFWTWRPHRTELAEQIRKYYLNRREDA